MFESNMVKVSRDDSLEELEENDENNIKLQELRTCANVSVRKYITPELLDKLNDVVSSSEIREEFRENILGYMDVLKGGKWKFEDYINAVKYVSYKLRNDTNIAAYTKTFPDRVARFQKEGHKDYSPWVTAYSKNKLVVAIMERSLIPTYILNADLYQKALNTQTELMMYAKSETVRMKAADSILIQLKPPEVQKMELEVGMKQDSTIEELKSTTMELVKQQKLMLESGVMNAREVAHSRLLIEGEVEEVIDNG